MSANSRRHKNAQPVARTRRRIVPLVEPLETRIVPTIVFPPAFGPDTIVSTAPYTVMSSATVYLILWGPNWTLTPGSSMNPNAVDANTVINEANAVVNSSYLSILDQYGSDGKASIPVHGVAIDNSTPPSDFAVASGTGLVGNSLTEAENEITSLINAGTLPGPVGNPTLAAAPIYAIIADPSDSRDGTKAKDGTPTISNAGVNRHGTVQSGPFNGDPINIIGVGTGNDNANFFAFSSTFSHEMVEKMSNPEGRHQDPNTLLPPAGSGVIVRPPADLPTASRDNPASPVTDITNWDQIADFEPEAGPVYAYRLGGTSGVEVQAAYSASDKAFVVEDNNSEVFQLTPDWDTTAGTASARPPTAPSISPSTGTSWRTRTTTSPSPRIQLAASR